MLTIYCTTPYFNCGHDGIAREVENLDEEELLHFIEKQRTKLLKVAPHEKGVFRKKFIEPHLSDDGFLVEEVVGVTQICDINIAYRIIIDKNITNLLEHKKQIEM